MAYLHSFLGCSLYIHDLLHLISGSMLRVRPNDRATAEELLHILEEKHQRALVDSVYLTNPQPDPGNVSFNEREQWIADHLVPGFTGIGHIERTA
jgi:hypothetical protein